jgi:hypothetical protein
MSYVYTKSYTSAREGEERKGEEKRVRSYQRNGASPSSLTSAIDGRSSHDSRLTRHRTARSHRLRHSANRRCLEIEVDK